MKNFFENCRTLEELRTEYRRLARIHHPDVGGDEETMKRINSQYEAAFNAMNSASEQPKDETAGEFIRVIDALMKLSGLNVELCGSWLWISGDTNPVKDQLKAAGCRWASKKSMWYWHPSDQAPKHRRGSASMEQIRSKYGSRVLAGAGRSDSELQTA